MGANYGLIEHSHASAAASAKVNHSYSIGGLTRHNDGVITASPATGPVRLDTTHGSTATGGLAATNNGLIQYSRATGTVTGGNRSRGLVGTSTGNADLDRDGIATAWEFGRRDRSGSPVESTRVDLATSAVDSCVDDVHMDGTVVTQVPANCRFDKGNGYNARYFTFSLDAESDVSVSLEGYIRGRIFLTLRSGAHTDGQILAVGRRIQETLPAGDYTPESLTESFNTMLTPITLIFRGLG